jgi:signal peptidase I
MTTDRQRWLAPLLGLVSPGLGHLYSGKPRVAIVLFLVGPLILAPLVGMVASYLPRPINVVTIYAVRLGFLAWATGGAYIAARRAPRPYQLQWFNRWWIYGGLFLLGAWVLLPFGRGITRRLVGQAFRIPSGAMEPTLLIGDYLFVRRDSRSPELGELVAFRSIEEPELVVLKRVVGVEGDTLEMRAGNLIRNGRSVSEPYAISTGPSGEANRVALDRMRAWQLSLVVGRDSGEYQPTIHDWGPVVVPPNTFFDLGDNRDASYDGRYYGPVPTSNVIGRAHTIYYSFDPMTYKPLPALTAVRWRRFGLVPR